MISNKYSTRIQALDSFRLIQMDLKQVFNKFALKTLTVKKESNGN